MSKSVSIVKLVIVAVVTALVCAILVAVANLGLQSNGAVAIAIGAFIGVMLSGFMFATIVKPEPKEKAPVRKNDADAARLMSVFVGNLAYKVRGKQLASLFEPYGKIHSLRIVKDRETGKAKGFGFIEMSERDAIEAIEALDDSEFFGRNLKVSEANSQKVN